MFRNLKNVTGLSVCLLVGVCSLYAGAATNAVNALPDDLPKVADPRDSAYDDLAVLTEALLMVRRHYVEEKSYKEIVYGALDGMMENLDPHSSFLDPEALKGMYEDTEGKFGGIGIRVGVRDRILTVIAPLEGSPAFRAGLMAGDRIVKISGKRAIGMSLKDALKLMRGEKGEEVTLTIQRKGEEDLFDVTMVRDDIKIPSILGVKMLNANTGYIRIVQFDRPSGNLFIEALLKLQAEGMSSLVLDLRNNPGGLLVSAVQVAQCLLPKDALIVTTRGRGGEPTDVPLKAEGQLHLTDLDVVVLINGGSASASEIVAGSLQDHNRAVVVGDTSFGKASVQTIMRMRSNPECAIRITMAHYFTPSERMIHGKGIEPDIKLTVSGSDWRDVQLKRAYEEQPGVYPENERKDLDDVSDRVLDPALDVLTALRVLKNRGQGF